MSHRPYPNADRALRQLGRRHVPQSAAVPAMRVAMADWAVAALASAHEAARPLREMLDALQAKPWHPDFVYDPATHCWERWPAV